MFNQFYPVYVIGRREVRDQFRDWRIVTPLVLLTLIFPVLMQFVARQMVNYVTQQGGGDILFERLFPFLLMVVGFFPVTISLVIALESFAGETERHSIEPLLDTPLEDWQLYLGKLIAGFFASVSASYFGTLIYIIGLKIVVDWLPPTELLVIIMILAFVQALVMVSGAIVVSTQTTSVRAANLLSSFIIVPMALLLQAESAIMFLASYTALWWIILGQIVIAGLLVRTGLAHFNREDLLGRELDSLNLKSSFRNFKKNVVGNAKNIRDWYRLEVWPAFWRLRLPVLFMIPLLIVGFYYGIHMANNLGSSDDMLDWMQLLMDPRIFENLSSGGIATLLTVFLIWMNNLKTVIIVLLLSIFTFGVAGVLALLATPFVLGLITGLAALAGISPWLLSQAYFLPHGIFEVPAIIIAGAAVLRLGTTMVTPGKDKSISQAWGLALADWTKVNVGIVTPLFLVAAFVEVFVTPRIAMLLMSG